MFDHRSASGTAGNVCLDARDASSVELADRVADQIGISRMFGANRRHANPLWDELGEMGCGSAQGN
jgi:hypothetical protein